MSTQALYRKWRSQTFDELVGQEHVVRTLRNAIRQDRVGHAYLFTGPRGVGKTTMARLLAKAVNCLAPEEERPCDHCSACQAIVENRAVDVIEMDAASHTGVDDAREIIERVQFRPAELQVKVYVIDEVHMLSSAAFNALLKTLEEPPAHVLFILATTEYHKVPATIVSRCQRFVFNRHTLGDIVAHLEFVAAQEQTVLEPGVADVIARSATGSMRDALSVLDQLMAGGDGTVTLTEARNLLGAADAGEVGAFVGALVVGDIPAGLQTINLVADNGVDLRQFGRDVVERLRALLVLVATGDTSTIDLPEEALAELETQAAQVNVAQMVGWLKLFANLDQQIKQSQYGALPLEIALVEALTTPVAAASNATQPRLQPRTPAPQSRRAPAVAPPNRPTQPTPSLPLPVEELTAPVVESGSPEDGEAVVLPVVADAAPRAAARDETLSPTVTPTSVIEVEDNAAFLLEEVEAQWEQLKDDLRAESRMVYALIDGIAPINIEGQTIVLLASKGAWQKQRLEDEKTRRLLERVLQKLLGAPARIRVTIDEREEMPDERKLLQHARRDSLVRKAINIFEAEIVGIDRL